MITESTFAVGELEAALGRLFLVDGVRVAKWSCQPLTYMQYRPGRAIVRVSGTALVAGRMRAWSLIVKHFGDPGSSPRAEAAAVGARRELNAYASGLLDGLPPGIVAPRCFGTVQRPAGVSALILEDVADRFGGNWPLPRFGLAARYLGRFNGAYLVDHALPTGPWLSLRWAEEHGDPSAALVVRERIDPAWQDPNVRDRLPAALADSLRRLLSDQAAFIGALQRLPSTLCHHDAAQANLFARQRPGVDDETVAVDWEEIGPGAIGAEIATLTFGTLRRGNLAAERAAELDRVVFDGYLKGLHDAGWDGDPDMVRFGYAAATALRWYLPAGLIRTVVDSDLRATVVENTGLSLDEFVRRRLVLADFLFARADEARDLGSRLRMW